MKIDSLKLRSKFYLAFAAVLMLGTLVAVVMVVMMQQSSAAYKQVLETDRRVAELALSLQAETLKTSDSLRGRLLHPYGDFGSQELENLSVAENAFDDTMATARKLVTDSAMIGTLDDIDRIDREKLNVLNGRIMDAIERQESAEAERLYFDEYLATRTEQQSLLDRLNSLAAERIQHAVERTRSQSRVAGMIGMALALLLIVSGCVLSYYLTRSFQRPIDTLMKTARAIASGDLDQKLSLERADELGEMADVLNQMVMNLRGLNEDLATQVRWLQETKDELARTQGQLVHNEKMAGLGQLVAGVAHELNNPISFVYSNTVLLKDAVRQVRRVVDFYDTNDNLPPSIKNAATDLKSEVDYYYLINDIEQALDDCHEGARRVRDIVLNLKTFSRMDESELQFVDIIEGIESTAKILSQFFRPDRVVLHRDYRDIPQLECYAGQLSQVWMNLMVNAAQAMDNKGDLWIGARTEGGRLIVQFRDNGPGIPREIQKRIFDPFFTTKRVGDGTGLGLSIVHGIIQRHNGEISVESELGVGTTFTVALPIICQPQAQVEEPAEAIA
jgi:signal transduction histidine kinase